ncbi:uncharacterized protein LOC111358112 isoform X2 [Spodoptera litura]|uniref:Uncharacterized protein LOC111358112 isoform X2 n=1 Tax=Spodoptera litura TaxID=69820 RepID=A0A9J7EJG9_SPOLT|nr:uncharacterized protein LOC111358112 isoform X2 [Spodoptera litura]
MSTLSSITIVAYFVVDATDLQDFVDAIINTNGGHSGTNSSQQQTNNTLAIVVPDSGYDLKTNEDRHKDHTRLYSNYTDIDDYLKLQNESGSFKSTNNRRMIVSSVEITTPINSNDSSSKKRVRKVRTYAPKPHDNSNHERRIQEIKEHMEHHFTSTLYLYNEAKRIERTHVVMDELRLMAEDADNPKYEFLREKVLECGRQPKVKIPKNIWKKPNNVVINIQKDPLNDNVPS